MPNAQTNLESIQDSAAHRKSITAEKFLENDVEGYEYVKGELVPMPPTSMEHGEISSNVIRYLSLPVFDHQLGRLYTDIRRKTVACNNGAGGFKERTVKS